MVTIRELPGALQHLILHQTSTDFTGLDHGPVETLAGLGNAQFGTSKAPLCYRRHPYSLGVLAQLAVPRKKMRSVRTFCREM